MQFKLSHKITPRWGTVIKTYRKSQKMTVKQFALYLGVTPQAVYYWEKNHREPPAVLTWAIYKELRDGK